MSSLLPRTTLLDELERRGVAYTVIPHRRTTTARDEARAVDMPASRVAKTIVLASAAGFVRVVVPATSRLDLHKARVLLGDCHARLATEAELAGAYPEYELGAVPPLGIGDGDRVLVDVRLCGIDDVVLEAGAHDRSIRISTSDLLEVAQAELVDIVE